ncbi:MAG: YqcC family protein [Gammaproteobacteria bacterium]|nr:YqcC family protein [Gammaproteobacteria bacterium]
MRDRLSDLLQTLEDELRLQGRWDAVAPPSQALRSTEPFAIDTLSFDQWLQWILLPKMRDLLRRQLPLPDNCAIHPMAEEVYCDDETGGTRLIGIIAEIDALLTEHHGGLN